MNSARITYTPRPDATPEAELDALATVYGYLLKKRNAVEHAPEPDATAIAEHKEGVSHVEQETRLGHQKSSITRSRKWRTQ